VVVPSAGAIQAEWLGMKGAIDPLTCAVSANHTEPLMTVEAGVDGGLAVEKFACVNALISILIGEWSTAPLASPIFALVSIPGNWYEACAIPGR
jgi:hypothetical protein